MFPSKQTTSTQLSVNETGFKRSLQFCNKELYQTQCEPSAHSHINTESNEQRQKQTTDMEANELLSLSLAQPYDGQSISNEIHKQNSTKIK